MVKVVYVEHNGTEHIVDVKAGLTLQEAAVKNNVPGIDADCGGACACATCQVYVDDAWCVKTGERSPMEEALLEFAPNAKPNSRLACQISVTADLDGLVVSMPPEQH
jgi:2Fe-2S ferredoxin